MNCGSIARRVLLMMAFVTGAGEAQLAPPPITTTSNGNGGRPMSAAEVEHHVWIQRTRTALAHSFRAKDYPIDSMHAADARASRELLSGLRTAGARGIQLDPSGGVGIAARDEPYSKQQIAERLATANLSLDDRAYTYMVAVQEFSNYYYPERLRDAESYLVKLDALGDAALSWRFRARIDLVDTYYRLGRSQEVLKHGLTALDMIPRMTFFDRCLMFSLSLPGCGSGELYMATIDALTGRPGGGAQIDALNKRLTIAIKASAADVSPDTGYTERGRTYEGTLKYMIDGTARLGTYAKPIVSNFWFNRSSSDSAVIAVNDGKIRVMEIAGYNCSPCLAALQGLQRLKAEYPDIDVMMVTATTGSWGNRLVSPVEEIDFLKEYFLNNQKVTFPIAVWKAEKVLNEDGGMTAQYYGPAFQDYPPLHKPTIWIVDGRGIIRRVILGFSRENEMQIAKTIQFLRKETKMDR
jgi:hypothetical protein